LFFAGLVGCSVHFFFALESEMSSATLIAGRFSCSTEILGEGIEGQVRLGRDVTTNEQVALKLIDRSRLSVKDVERLDLEINILVSLRHPNIIALKHAELYAQGNYHYCINEDLL
jgi:serine/threonine protein kinase